MNTFDIVILGGGMVGLALARALADSPLSLAVVEPSIPKPLANERDFSLRVSAISPASAQFLDELGVWSALMEQRVQPYKKMHVWEKDSFAKIDFDCQQAMLSNLGHIIENEIIRDGLWQQVCGQANVTIIDERCQQLERGQREAWLQFERFGMVSAQLVVGADGAHSWLRQQCDVPVTFWDYQHHALVASIHTELPHQECARQVFSADGPLAFLPLSDPHQCSIVWSLPQARAQALQQMSLEQFNHELMVAFDQKLGISTRVSELQAFPLRMRYARQFAGDRFVLVGDAAHTIHPLAGQGVNLGFADVQALAMTIKTLAAKGDDLGKHRLLRAWERERKADAMVMIAAMEFFKQLFAGAHPAKKLLRGMGMSISDRLSPLKLQWMRRALGLANHS
ncbi:FAD-dependent monooxygenase [Celerinatantimonas yamalensis]|uniref:FAD-dependent monooxygenase n=1 Tax=Celerinatantimonas yamalensis TaxID=559956 RepID=A0ABW9GBI1_9GAMM